MERRKFFKKGVLTLGLATLGVGVVNDVFSSDLTFDRKFKLYNPWTLQPFEIRMYKDKDGNIVRKVKKFNVKHPFFVIFYSATDFKPIYCLVDKDENGEIIKTEYDKINYKKIKKSGIPTY